MNGKKLVFMFCTMLRKWSLSLRVHMTELRDANPRKIRCEKWIHDEHNRTFREWIRKYLHMKAGHSQDLTKPARGPSSIVTRYTSYFVNGYSFYTYERDEKHPVQHSGLAPPTRGRRRPSRTTTIEQYVEELMDLFHTLVESVAHLVGGQLPHSQAGDDLADHANPNDLPNGENQREEAEGVRETSGDNNHPPPARPKRNLKRAPLCMPHRPPVRDEYFNNANGGRPPMPHQPPMSDDYFYNASTIDQFSHPEGDLTDHLRARQGEVW
ncbi:hypothetical protein TIFTF001_038909 [Ficus carica]|uniref:Uncharacterized protein n=1 Tax=Ficus carica TaxID=3494 RepID=A0AA88EBD8_FICCA|nr:hypothetical protein TIFTF001_038909 [Ficus carica]